MERHNPAPPWGGGARAGNTKADGEGGYRTASPGAAQADIECLSIRWFDASGNVKAFVSIRIGEIVVHGCKVVCQPGQKAWLAPPDHQWTGRDGEVKWSPIVEMDKELQRRVQPVVIAAWLRQP